MASENDEALRLNTVALMAATIYATSDFVARLASVPVRRQWAAASSAALLKAVEKEISRALRQGRKTLAGGDVRK